MAEIIVNNIRSTINGYLGKNSEEFKLIQESLREALSYEVVGAEYSPKFKSGQWDGKITLYKHWEKSFPTGCLNRVIECLKQNNISCKIIDNRAKPEKNYPLDTAFHEYNITPYFYQIEAANRAIKKTRGVLSLATGSGKTITSCEILARLSVAPVVFVVPTLSLLKQTHSEFVKFLRYKNKPPHIGFIGESVCDINENGINVATYQTILSAFNKIYKPDKKQIVDANENKEKNKKSLYELKNEYKQIVKMFNEKKAILENQYNNLEEKEKNKIINSKLKDLLEQINKYNDLILKKQQSLKNKEKIRTLVNNCKCLYVDEGHIAAEIIEFIGNQAPNAYYRYAQTATPFRLDNQEIRIEGTFGRKFIEIKLSDLIELDFLVQPYIIMLDVKHYVDTHSYVDSYNSNIVHNNERNWKIKQIAEFLKSENIPTLILVEKIEHGEILESIIEDSVFVCGSDNEKAAPTDEEKDYRRRMLNKLENNEIILIATQWAYVGVNAPAIAGLIIAGSPQSPVTLYQMIGRALRKAPDKERAYIIDFSERAKDLHSHSLIREKIYKSEPQWLFKKIKAPN